MREDLIERLRREADISARPGQMDRLNALADEFAAALEAAREDAELWRKHAPAIKQMLAALDVLSPLVLTRLKLQDAALKAAIGDQNSGSNS